MSRADKRPVIEVRMQGAGNPLEFRVTVREGNGKSEHEVTLGQADFARLSNGQLKAGALIEAAFRFLLDREPKESILRRFDITVIGRYFPEFERELPRYLH